MGHNIAGFIIKGKYDIEISKQFDLEPIDIGYGLTLFLTDIYHATYWQHILKKETYLKLPSPKMVYYPTEGIISYFVEELTSVPNSIYVLIATDYAGGVGSQCAFILQGLQHIEKQIATINGVLTYLGVVAKENTDEFHSVGLPKYRQTPAHLDKYWDLCDELGI